jgi:phosphatidylserine decarboxylase
MRVPLTKYGWPQVVVIPGAVLVVMLVFALGAQALLPLWSVILMEVLLAAVFIWSLAFFRDPLRRCPSDTDFLLAPADGRVTDIEVLENSLRIGIFLSIFNTHINRAPCNVKVEKITYKKGKYKNAMNPESARVNESNDLNLVRTDFPYERLVVRQISGAIARRIVCDCSVGEELTAGEKFGMIKFGSRTELYVASSVDAFASGLDEQYRSKCLVQIGDKVKAGLTPLVKYERYRK